MWCSGLKISTVAAMVQAAPVAQIQSLAQELLRAAGVAKKKKKKSEGKLSSHTVGWNEWLYNEHRKQHESGSIKKLKIELPYDPAIPLLGQKDTCTPAPLPS